MNIPSLNGFELSNLALMVGVVVATLQNRRSGINAGGLISAAFIILAAGSSIYLSLLIMVMGLVISLVFKRFFSHVYSGREPMFYMAFMSVVGMLGVSYILRDSLFHGSVSPNFLPGLIVPAILASAINKQGALVTYRYLFQTIAISAACLLVIYQLGMDAGHNFAALNQVASSQSGPVSGGVGLALASVVIGFIVYKRQQVKFAGYIILPFLASLLLASPFSFVLLLAMAAMTYAATALLRRHSMIIGIGRYSFVLILSVILVWTAQVVLLRYNLPLLPFLGTTIFASMTIAVIVNDATIYGLRRSMPAFGVGLAAMMVLLLGLHFASVGLHVASPVSIGSL